MTRLSVGTRSPDLATGTPPQRPIAVCAGLPTIRFHDLRHTSATLLLSLGTNPKVVQELLGHSGIAVTMDVYSHVLPTMQQEAMSDMDKLLSA